MCSHGSKSRLPSLAVALGVGLLAMGGCPKRGDEGELDRVAPWLAEADAAWEARGEGGFAPVQEALDQAFGVGPEDGRVLWRLARLEVGQGLAADDPREAVRSFARARTIGLDCMDVGPALQRSEAAPAGAIADRITPDEAECLAWTTFAWARWLEAFGPQAAAVDLDALDALIARQVQLDPDPRLLDWTRGLLAAVRPPGDGQDLEEARRWLDRAVQADPDDLATRADLVWEVALPLRDRELVEAQTRAIEAVTPRTPEDQRAARRVAALRSRSER